MTDIDISPEAVERMACILDGRGGFVKGNVVVATLRALSAALTQSRAERAAAYERAAEAAIKYRPTGPNAKHFVDVLVVDIATAILALRDKPAPGVTPKIEVKFTWAKGDEEFWVHLKSPDGKSAGFNLGNPKGMIATALLRAIAGGGDE